jgi:hypothetical protein
MNVPYLPMACKQQSVGKWDAGAFVNGRGQNAQIAVGSTLSWMCIVRGK